jgi:hypothetical protein
MQACVASLKLTPPRVLLTEAHLGELWIAIGDGACFFFCAFLPLTEPRVAGGHGTPIKLAVDTVKEILTRIKFVAAWDEKEAEETAKRLQPKGHMSFLCFKRFLMIATKEAQLMGVLRLDDRLRVDPATHEELLLWTEMNTRLFEVQENHAPPRGAKLKKGSVLRAKRKRMKDPNNFRLGCEYYAEDSKGHVYMVDSAKLAEVEGPSVTPKLVASFQKLDEERGEQVCDLEKDPMGLTLSHPVLGVDVPTAVRNSPGAVDLVPSFLRQCVDYIDEHVIEEGLYRIPGGSRRINEMCLMANQGRALILEPGDVENCCSVVVRWLRTLPDHHGLLWNGFTGHLRGDYSSAAGNDTLRRQIMRQVVGLLPPENSRTLKFLLHHFQRVGEADNKMTLKNIDICIPGGFDIPSLVSYAPFVWDDWNAPEPQPPQQYPAQVANAPMSVPAGPGVVGASSNRVPPVTGSARSPRSSATPGGLPVPPARASDAVPARMAIPSGGDVLTRQSLSHSTGSSPAISRVSPRRNTGNDLGAPAKVPSVPGPNTAPASLTASPVVSPAGGGGVAPTVTAPANPSPQMPPSRSPPRSPSQSPRAEPRLSPRFSPRDGAPAVGPPGDVPPPLPELPPLPALPAFQPNLARK